MQFEVKMVYYNLWCGLLFVLHKLLRSNLNVKVARYNHYVLLGYGLTYYFQSTIKLFKFGRLRLLFHVYLLLSVSRIELVCVHPSRLPSSSPSFSTWLARRDSLSDSPIYSIHDICFLLMLGLDRYHFLSGFGCIITTLFLTCNILFLCASTYWSLLLHYYYYNVKCQNFSITTTPRMAFW